MNVIEYTKNHPDTEKVVFASKFLSKDSTRETLKLFHVEKEGDKTVMVATDGRKIAKVVLSQDIPCGNYKVLNLKKTAATLVEDDSGLQYPASWTQVYPATIGARKFEVHSRMEICYSAALCECYIDFDNNLPDGIKGTLYVQDQLSPIRICSDETDVVIMPFRAEIKEIS